jgi:hypothetical protein
MARRIATVIAAALGLAACNTHPGEEITGGETVSGLSSWTDPETGCAYIIGHQTRASGATAITPRLDADGLPDCPGATAWDDADPPAIPMRVPLDGG